MSEREREGREREMNGEERENHDEILSGRRRRNKNTRKGPEGAVTVESYQLEA